MTKSGLVVKSMILVSAMASMMSMNIHAATVDDVAMTAAGVGAGTWAGKNGYIESVKEVLKGRAGYGSPKGTKGLIHEVNFCNLEDVKDFFSGNKNTTKLTKSSTATQVDVVKTDSSGSVIARYQLKDGPSKSTAYDTATRVEAGQYQQVQLIGTKESVKPYAEEAAKKGLTKEMKSSGISSKTNEAMAKKVLADKAMTTSELVSKNAKGAGVIGSLIEGGVATYEAISSDMDIHEGISHVAVAAGNGAVSGYIAGAVGTSVGVAIAGAGAGPAVCIAVPAVAATASGLISDEALDYVEEKIDLEGKVETFTHMVDDGTEVVAEFVTEKFSK